MISNGRSSGTTPQGDEQGAGAARAGNAEGTIDVRGSRWRARVPVAVASALITAIGMWITRPEPASAALATEVQECRQGIAQLRQDLQVANAERRGFEQWAQQQISVLIVRTDQQRKSE